MDGRDELKKSAHDGEAAGHLKVTRPVRHASQKCHVIYNVQQTRVDGTSCAQRNQHQIFPCEQNSSP